MDREEGAEGCPEDDPRLNAAFVRTVTTGPEAPVHLVGVVHDHPASSYRARATVESQDPDVLALEVAPVALPFFREAAGDERAVFGGEFSAAVAAAEDARVVGIDAPNGRFVAALARRCVAEGHAPSTVRQLLGGTASATREALACRLAATVSRRTRFSVDVGDPVAHDCEPSDDPAAQAADEARQVDRVEAVLGALQRPPALRLRDETRETCMARTLHALRQEGSVVAVVGQGHLDPIAAELEERAAGAGVDATASRSDARWVDGLLRAVGRRASDA